MGTALQDLRYALRTLWSKPAFTVVAVVALALGIGATASIFSTVYAVVFEPLPYPELDRIVRLWRTVPNENIDRSLISPADYRDLRAGNQVFSDMAATSSWEANLTGVGEPERLEGDRVTPSYFGVIGVNALLGRTLVPADSENGGARVLVLAHGFWQRRLAGDQNIVGKQLTLNGQSYAVVGVMPADVGIGTEIWAPLAFTPAESVSRDNHYLTVVARLKPAISLPQAQAAMKTIAARLAQQYPRSNEGSAVRLQLLREDLTFGTRQFVLTLMGASVFVLLLACANVANLQLARVVARRKEMAIRAALGAHRWRLVRQVLIESTIVGLAGGVGGLLLGAWSINLSRTLIPPFIRQHVAGLHIRLNWQVVAFTFAVSLVAGLLSGAIAAVHASRGHVQETLKEGGRTDSTGAGRHPARAMLVISEVALALVLLVGAGLMVNGFRNLMALNQGYEPDKVLTVSVSLPATQYGQLQKRAAFYDQVLHRLQALPGAESAGIVQFLPAGFSFWSGEFRIAGRPEPTANVVPRAIIEAASPDYFRSVRIPLVKGRLLSEEDGTYALPVVVISQMMSNRYFPNENPMGRQIRVGRPDENSPWRTIVGVVADIKQSPFIGIQPTAYVPVVQAPPLAATFLVRSKGDPMILAVAARQQINAVDPDQAVHDVRAMRDVLGDMVSGVRYAGGTMGVFAVVALVLASAGIYAVMAYSVVQRTHEIGVRVALGAGQFQVIKLILSQAMRLTSAGLLIGIPAALTLSHFLASVLFGVMRIHSLLFAALTLLLTLIAMLAGYIPARRAARVDPMIALRYE